MRYQITNILALAIASTFTQYSLPFIGHVAVFMRKLENNFSTMASEDEPRPYMDQVPELRKKFLDKHYASDKNYYDSRDISRVKSDDLFVQQYLIGREGNVDKAHKLMVEALKWRNEFGINDVSEKDIPEEILKSGYLYVYGKDKTGASLVHVHGPKYTKGGKEKLLGYKKLFALTFEKHQRDHPGERLSCVNQAKNCGLDNMEMDFNKFATYVQSTYYPDMLEQAYILDFPTLLQGIWKIVKGLLGSRLNKKYIFMTAEELSPKYVDKDQLPLDLGGPSFEYKYPPEDKTDSNSNEQATAEAAS